MSKWFSIFMHQVVEQYCKVDMVGISVIRNVTPFRVGWLLPYLRNCGAYFESSRTCMYSCNYWKVKRESGVAPVLTCHAFLSFATVT